MTRRKSVTDTIAALAIGLATGIGATGAFAAGEGELCAGVGGIQCDAGLECEMPAGSDDINDAAGECVKPADRGAGSTGDLGSSIEGTADDLLDDMVDGIGR